MMKNELIPWNKIPTKVVLIGGIVGGLIGTGLMLGIAWLYHFLMEVSR